MVKIIAGRMTVFNIMLYGMLLLTLNQPAVDMAEIQSRTLSLDRSKLPVGWNRKSLEDFFLMDDYIDNMPKRGFNEYGHIRFGRKDKEFDDYGHLKFGK